MQNSNHGQASGLGNAQSSLLGSEPPRRPENLTSVSAPVPLSGRISSIRIRRGLLSRAGSEAEDRITKPESPLTLTSEDEDPSISDSGPLPRRFAALTGRITSNSGYGSRKAFQSSLSPTPWNADSGNHSGSGKASASDGGSGLGRAKSISSVSSVNSTSSLEAAPFREAPLGNVRVGFGGLGPLRTSGPRSTRSPLPQVGEPSNQAFSSSHRGFFVNNTSGIKTPLSGDFASKMSADRQTEPLSRVPEAPKPSTRGPYDFHFGETLGEGSYSTVLEAWDLLSGSRPKQSGVIDPLATSASAAMVGGGRKRWLPKTDLTGRKAYAIKVLNKVHILKQNKQKYVNVEKEALSRLIKHPGVVKLFWTFQDRDSLYFVLGLATNGELLSFIRKFGSFDETSARFYAAQLVDTIRAMHNAGVIHRDMKPENILLDSAMRIKVTDFGSAKIIASAGHPGGKSEPPSAVENGSRTSSFVGTAEYVSPELLVEKSQPAGKPSDWWAFGCVLFQMIAGRLPFKGPNEYQTLQKVKNRDFGFPEDFPEDARDLVDKLLSLEPDQRPSSPEIQAHPYFSSIDFHTLWDQPSPPIQTGITPPSKLLQRIPSTSDISFDEDFVSEQSFEPNSDAGEAASTPQHAKLDNRRRRTNDADDSDLSEASSDAAPDIPADSGVTPRMAQRRGSGLLRIMDGLTNRASATSLDQQNLRNPSGSGLSIFGSSSPSMLRRRISALSIDTAGSSRNSRDPTKDAVSSRLSRETRSLPPAANASPGPSLQSPGTGSPLSWNALLLPHELMLYSCPVIQKKTGTGKIFSKRRQLILTDFPRLLCVKETGDALKLKSEVILDLSNEPRDEGFSRLQSSSTIGEGEFTATAEGASERVDTAVMVGPNLLAAVDYKGGKSFTVRTNSKASIYEVYAGDASSVVRGIREARQRP